MWMSRDTGIPIVALRFSGSRGFHLGGWDRKFVPFLFSEIIVSIGDGIYVNEENLQASESAVTKHLNGK